MPRSTDVSKLRHGRNRTGERTSERNENFQVDKTQVGLHTPGHSIAIFFAAHFFVTVTAVIVFQSNLTELFSGISLIFNVYDVNYALTHRGKHFTWLIKWYLIQILGKTAAVKFIHLPTLQKCQSSRWESHNDSL